MEVANEDREETSDTANPDSIRTGEISQLYTQLRNEENKTKDLITELNNLKTELLKLQNKISEDDIKAKQIEEDLKNQLVKQETSATESDNKSKKRSEET